MLTQRRLLATIGLAALAVGSAPVATFADDQPTKTAVNIELKDTSVKNAIDVIFRGTNLKYRVDPGVYGNIGEIRLKGVTVDRAIKAVADLANLTIRMENGAYIISPNNEVNLGVTRHKVAPTDQEQQPELQSESSEEAAYQGQQPINPVYQVYWGPPAPQVVSLGVGLQMINPYGLTNPYGYGVPPFSQNGYATAIGNYPGVRMFGGQYTQPSFGFVLPY